MGNKWDDPQYMEARWETLCEMAQACRDCGLHEGVTQKVVGDPPQWTGPKPIVFIGEAPGADEDAEGIPFVGKSGQKLRQHLRSIRLPENLYGIMNTVQCRPPGNREPEPPEITACSRFFMEKLRMWNPRVIVPLGKPACRLVFGISSFQITTNACVERKSNIKHGSFCLRIPAFPMPHPRWGIHNPDVYAGMWEKLDVWLASQGIANRAEE